MNGFIQSAILACQEVDALVKEGHSSLFLLHERGMGGDISNGADLRAEAICFSHLSPYGSIFSEESGWMSPQSDITIFLDPIDGSDNFVSQLPYYGVSIARVCGNKTTEALVCNLANGDLFIRTEDEYYRTTLKNPLEKHEIVISLSAKVGLFEKAPEHPDLIKKLMAKRLKFRSPGALALSLAYAPYVKYVLFLGTMRPYDIQAGLYLSEHLHLFCDDRYLLLCADKELFEQIRSIVEKEYF
ncbi:MAG: inositol monophosphatase family protein [Sulfuricurvum sp.]|uniref:inositol monophosphatase family protein n=1 Tax=Sulfuricurvum sp. TaxID=2025608 RepID=UPI0027181F2E|nr:inositol monophosphatase family protein [Sulfuricurvum sp.]MDO9056047.1 inositol monophosphatase family protein [Sulfuricurvum sp.]MDP3291621.1 inositol monophosphatase family protein [Sulfuricurvum sp.]